MQLDQMNSTCIPTVTTRQLTHTEIRYASAVLLIMQIDILPGSNLRRGEDARAQHNPGLTWMNNGSLCRVDTGSMSIRNMTLYTVVKQLLFDLVSKHHLLTER